MKTGVMMLKIRLCVTGKNYILKIQIEIIFNNTTVFSLFVIA